VALRNAKLLELVRFLALDDSPRTANALLVRDCMTLSPSRADLRVNANIEIQPDWHDYGPIRNGTPEIHYRVRITRPGVILSEESRVKNLEEVRLLICKAFGWQ
jgi:hypothetical protein